MIIKRQSGRIIPVEIPPTALPPEPGVAPGMADSAPRPPDRPGPTMRKEQRRGFMGSIREREEPSSEVALRSSGSDGFEAKIIGIHVGPPGLRSMAGLVGVPGSSRIPT
jgi:hypothetical protein